MIMKGKDGHWDRQVGGGKEGKGENAYKYTLLTGRDGNCW